eukprot:1146495-Pelagomonas_calceolata.AAC.4
MEQTVQRVPLSVAQPHLKHYDQVCCEPAATACGQDAHFLLLFLLRFPSLEIGAPDEPVNLPIGRYGALLSTQAWSPVYMLVYVVPDRQPPKAKEGNKLKGVARPLHNAFMYLAKIKAHHWVHDVLSQGCVRFVGRVMLLRKTPTLPLHAPQHSLGLPVFKARFQSTRAGRTYLPGRGQDAGLTRASVVVKAGDDQ